MISFNTKILAYILSFISINVFGSLTFSSPIDIGSGSLPKITTSSSGQYVYAIWQGTGNIVQASVSSDFGATWSALPINLGSGLFAKITTSSSGQYVYAIFWQDAGIVQVVYGIDIRKRVFCPITLYPVRN